MNPRPVTRNAVTSDAAAIAGVQVRAWQAAYRDFMPPAFLDQMSAAGKVPQWHQALLLDYPKLLVVEEAGEVAGFCALGHRREAGAAAGDYEVWAFYVAPPFWGRGLAQALWREALQRLARIGATQVSLWVIVGNARATAFYQRIGFVPDQLAIDPVPVAGVIVPHQCYCAPVSHLLACAAADGDPKLR